MNARENKTSEDKSRASANTSSPQRRGTTHEHHIAPVQNQLHHMANHNPGVNQLKAYQQMANDSLQASFIPAYSLNDPLTLSKPRATVQRLKSLQQVTPPGVIVTPKQALLRYVRYLIRESWQYEDRPDFRTRLAVIGAEIDGTNFSDIKPDDIFNFRARIAEVADEIRDLENPAAAGSAEVAAPAGYTKVTAFGQSVYLDTGARLDAVAKAHLVSGAFGGTGWHQSSNISGATAADHYLHPSKKDPTLYLLRDDGVHAPNGLRKFTITKTGNVSGGMHRF